MAADRTLTPKKKAAFLAALSECGNVTKAATAAGVDRVYMYEVRTKDEEFATAWEEAAKVGAKALEDEARRRAMEGVDEPVFYQGQMCGTVRKYSDTLLIVLLKAHHPEKYAERSKNEHTSPDGSMTPTPALDLSHLSADDLMRLTKTAFAEGGE